ncbi:oxygen-insensitive NADPH nitroreductase [Oceanospirillum linum]|uniref:Nitroreductase A n=1 Tax=Oceanospirillum linum TaxID=966 RepID=A0A1T1H9Z4_OCELI|nr:oxygen-insensitive NADPH nitroreductase [Oceanospirillum linum]OOV86537.1 nitroreductase A [Oceanospirillum linum]SEG36100.1 nitroreductase [Oleiphilus messinensis]SMP30028.1 nitroreductase [Oceanospirillum linum]
MNQTIETILSHRSIRKFTEQAIPQEVLATLIDCARAASSSSNIQCVSVIRITDAKKRELLSEYAGGQGYVASAAEFLVFCADFNRHQQIKPDSRLGFMEQTLIGAVDSALMAQNCLLAAESLGLGGVYIGGLRNNPDKVCELLNLPENVFPMFGMCLGYPDQDPALKPRLPADLILHTDNYQPLDAEKLAEYDATMREYYDIRTGGKLDQSWSDQIKAILSKEARPFIQGSLNKQGFAKK